MPNSRFFPGYRPRVLTLAGMIAAAAAARLIPHPPNFTPIAAIALFGGACFRDLSAAFAVPLGAMVLSDLVLGLTVYGMRSLLAMPLVYLCFALTVVMGRWIRRTRSLGSIAGAALASSVLFYLVTNFGVWAGGERYPKSLEGLAACYLAALPFFRNMVVGNAFYTVLLFGGFALAGQVFPVLREEAVASGVRK